MYKIALLGCENSHARNFMDLIAAGKYPEIEVVGVYSNEPESVQILHDVFGVKIMENYDDLVGQVDGIMVTARHGDNHYKYAKPYMDDGIPMFIDKPITHTEADAVEFMAEAKKRGLRFCGGSVCASLKETLELAQAVEEQSCGKLLGGSLACPINLNNIYGGFTFYTQHLVEVMLTIFGRDVKAVLAERTNDTVTVLFHYNGFCVTGMYGEGLPYYNVSVFGSKGSLNKTLSFTTESFMHEMNEMMDLLQGKPMEKSYEDFVQPVFIINAMMRSLESGKWEAINPIVL